ncbi:MAG: iron-containing alcohol dehydrogenase [Acidobacteria bacterium]|nr:iron-containing alcohol dehydrogenase [Acidobacteriota bacterium]
MQFEFATAGRVVFGAGSVKKLPAAVRAFGRRVLVVTGRDPDRAAGAMESMRRESITCSPFGVSGEPELERVSEGVATARNENCDVVVSIGGGSPIDAGKAIAVLLTNPGGALEYLEVIGRGRPLTEAPVPFIAVPTTAGTGSEVTRNAVLASREHQVKASLRSPAMLPRLAIVDPELTNDLPRSLTASTGLDALTQLIEPYVSIRANAMTDPLCRDGIARAVRALPRAFRNGRDVEARSEMALASLLGGMALANAGLGAVHGFAAPIGGTFHAPHGAVCAALLPHSVEVNLRALRERAPQSRAIGRYGEVAAMLTGNPNARPEDAIDPLLALCREFGVPQLSEYGIGPQHVDPLCAKASEASSMKANPIVLTRAELAGLLTRAI